MNELSKASNKLSMFGLFLIGGGIFFLDGFRSLGFLRSSYIVLVIAGGLMLVIWSSANAKRLDGPQ